MLNLPFPWAHGVLEAMEPVISGVLAKVGRKEV